MDCAELFGNVKTYWPSSVALNEDTFDTLNLIYREFESKIAQDEESWLEVSSWAFHQTIWSFAEQQSYAGQKEIKISDIPISLFNEKMLSNLKDGSWAEERQKYVPL